MIWKLVSFYMQPEIILYCIILFMSFIMTSIIIPEIIENCFFFFFKLLHIWHVFFICISQNNRIIDSLEHCNSKEHTQEVCKKIVPEAGSRGVVVMIVTCHQGDPASIPPFPRARHHQYPELQQQWVRCDGSNAEVKYHGCTCTWPSPPLKKKGQK